MGFGRSHSEGQEDGTEKDTTIHEGRQLKQLVDLGKSPPGGIWFNKTKYTVVQCDKAFEMGESTYFWAFCSKPKGGAHVVCTGDKGQIVVGFYAEEKGQSSGNCKKTVPAFAEYLKGIGY